MNDKLLIDVRPFKNEENEDEVNPFTEDEVESLLKASEGRSVRFCQPVFSPACAAER
jgi:hypothetical protein